MIEINQIGYRIGAPPRTTQPMAVFGNRTQGKIITGVASMEVRDAVASKVISVEGSVATACSEEALQEITMAIRMQDLVQTSSNSAEVPPPTNHGVVLIAPEATLTSTKHKVPRTSALLQIPIKRPPLLDQITIIRTGTSRISMRLRESMRAATAGTDSLTASRSSTKASSRVDLMDRSLR